MTKICQRCGCNLKFGETYELLCEKINKFEKINGREVWIADGFKPEMICVDCYKEFEGFMNEYTIRK